jgi:hypothetical protein
MVAELDTLTVRSVIKFHSRCIGIKGEKKNRNLNFDVNAIYEVAVTWVLLFVSNIFSSS